MRGARGKAKDSVRQRRGRSVSGSSRLVAGSGEERRQSVSRQETQAVAVDHQTRRCRLHLPKSGCFVNTQLRGQQRMVGGHSGTRTGGQLRESGGRCSRARNPRYGEIGLLYGPPERELACLLSRSRSVVIEGHACPARQRAGMRRVRLMSSKPKAKDP